MTDKQTKVLIIALVVIGATYSPIWFTSENGDLVAQNRSSLGGATDTDFLTNIAGAFGVATVLPAFSLASLSRCASSHGPPF
jgi:hypothetical protein